MFKRLLCLLSVVILSACSATIDDYKTTTPKLDIFQFFSGKTQAWGMVQDYTNKQNRRFHVDITGTVEGNNLTLHEEFLYDDGETQTRDWHIQRLSDGSYQGTAGDIEGLATGKAQGNAFNWKYQMNVKTGGKTYLLTFDDWMYLQDEKHLFNVTSLNKFGFQVGKVTLFFIKE